MSARHVNARKQPRGDPIELTGLECDLFAFEAPGSLLSAILYQDHTAGWPCRSTLLR